LAELVASTVDGLALHAAFLDSKQTRKQLRALALRAVLALVEGDGPRPGPIDGNSATKHKE